MKISPIFFLPLSLLQFSFYISAMNNIDSSNRNDTYAHQKQKTEEILYNEIEYNKIIFENPFENNSWVPLHYLFDKNVPDAVSSWEIDQNKNKTNETIDEGSHGIINLLRYIPKLNKSNNDQKDFSKKPLTFTVVQAFNFFGERSIKNPHYCDHTSEGFQEFLHYGRDYLNEYNKERMSRNKKPKFIHFLACTIKGGFGLIRGREKGAEFLASFFDTFYQKSPLIFFAEGIGCPVVDSTSNKIAPRKGNKARILELIYFDPLCQQCIPDHLKTNLISLAEYINNNFVACQPNNFEYLTTFYGKKNTLWKTINERNVSATVGSVLGAGAVTYVAYNSDNEKIKYLSKPLAGVGGVATLALVLDSLKTANKQLRISHAYEDVLVEKKSFKSPDGKTTIINRGPINQILTYCDGEKISNNNVLAYLKHFREILKTTKEKFPAHYAISSYFTANIIGNPDQYHTNASRPQLAVMEFTDKETGAKRYGTKNDNNANFSNSYYETIIKKLDARAKEIKNRLRQTSNLKIGKFSKLVNDDKETEFSKAIKERKLTTEEFYFVIDCLREDHLKAERGYSSNNSNLSNNNSNSSFCSIM